MIAIILAIFAAAAALWWVFREDIEQETIRFERSKRYAAYAAGLVLPGTPDLGKLDERLAARGLKPGAPVLIRIFKREFELELWMQKDGRFQRFATYPICRWSGRLGPKLKTGDGQAPEGFYTVGPEQLNPNSRWLRSFNLGFPNAFDRAYGRTGSFLMVHGGCGSIGCYAMTNGVIMEIWRLVTAALDGGQKRFQVQAFPFRMTEANLAARPTGETTAFWRNLKAGYDLFEKDLVPPKVTVCGKAYTFAPADGAADGSAPVEAGCPGKT
jgi:murein L,D-transpeptidase YafK